MRAPNSTAKRLSHDKKPKEFEEQMIEVARVSRTMAGGRRISFRATMAIGDKKGRVGIGTGKSKEVMDAASKAVKKAKKGLITVPIINGTIPHEIRISYKGARILLKPAAPGTGIIAGGVIRTIARLAGINNIISKSLGSANKINNLKATINAFKLLNKEQKQLNDSKVKDTKDEKSTKVETKK